jgi:hypothetical protein
VINKEYFQYKENQKYQKSQEYQDLQNLVKIDTYFELSQNKFAEKIEKEKLNMINRIKAKEQINV